MPRGLVLPLFRQSGVSAEAGQALQKLLHRWELLSCPRWGAGASRRQALFFTSHGAGLQGCIRQMEIAGQRQGLPAEMAEEADLGAPPPTSE